MILVFHLTHRYFFLLIQAVKESKESSDSSDDSEDESEEKPVKTPQKKVGIFMFVLLYVKFGDLCVIL